jgi:putative peptidoglycan lipid II flippase
VLPAGLLAYATTRAFASWSDSRGALVLALVTAGVVAVPAFLLMSRLLRISEVGDIVGTFVRRGRRSSSSSAGRDASDTSPGDGDDPGSPGGSTVLMAAASPTIDSAQNAAPSPPDPGGPLENTDSMVTRPGDTERPEAGQAPVSGEAATEAEAPTRPSAPAAAAMPAGTVLADRYRLEELLGESQPTVTWRAFDLVLSRSVLVHLLPPRDPGAADLLSAARQASVATDSRFLRVLDAVYSDHPELGSYIVCEYATGQSLELILSQGPLTGLEAAWVVREVADALSGVHAYGLYHRRINPDTVIVTPTGNIKIVGLMIEAALKPNRGSVVHGADTPELVDVLDLGRLLYAALVARWPGGPAFGMPDAPVLGRRWMTPRQVRAGVSPALDAVCDQILGEPPRHRAPQLTSANDVVNALTKVLGTADASGDLERRLRQPVPRVGTNPSTPVSSLLDQRTEAHGMDGLEQRTEQMARVDLPGSGVPASSAPPVHPDGGPAAHAVRGAVSGIPVAASAVSAYSSSGHESSQTTLIRQPPPPAAKTSRSAGRKPPGGGPGAGPAVRRGPRRWVALLVALVAMLVIAGLVSAYVLNNRAPGASPTDPTSPATSAQSSGPPSVIPVKDGRDFDPQGDDNSENPDQVKNAFDGSDDTRWQTLTYFRNPKLGGLKRGVGLVLDLGEPQPVGSVKVTLSGSGTAVQLRVPEDDPASVTKPPMSSDGRWRTVSKESKAKKTATLELEEKVTTRFVLVYLTSLPKEGSGYRGGIYEVEVYS